MGVGGRRCFAENESQTAARNYARRWEPDTYYVGHLSPQMMQKRPVTAKQRCRDSIDERTAWWERPQVDPSIFDHSTGGEESADLASDNQLEQLQLAQELGWSDERLGRFRKFIRSIDPIPI